MIQSNNIICLSLVARTIVLFSLCIDSCLYNMYNIILVKTMLFLSFKCSLQILVNSFLETTLSGTYHSFWFFLGGGGVGWGGVESAKTHRVYILSTELSRATRNQMKPFFCKALSWQPHGLAYNPKTLMVLCYVGSLGCLIPSACMNTDPGICLQGVLALCHPAQTCCIWQ